MPVDIQTWRARIGTYNAGRLSAIQIRYGLPKSLESKKGLDVLGGCSTILVTVLLLLYGVLRGRIGVSDIIRVRCGGRSKAGVSSMKVASVSCGAALLLFGLAMALSLLLMQAGDVERNPGPSILTMEDLPVLMAKLKEVAGKWHPLGIRLHFTPGALIGFPPAIQDDPILALQELLTNWMQRSDPPPTLESLAEAVGGPVIENELLARTLLEQRADFPSVQTKDIAAAGEKRILRDDTEEKIVPEPILKDLLKVQANDWYALGLFLGVSEDELDCIEKDNRGDVKTCRRLMFREWLNHDNATYQQLVEALEAIGEETEAARLCKTFGLSLPTPRSPEGEEMGTITSQLSSEEKAVQEEDSQKVIRKLENEVKTLEKDKSNLKTVISELEERIAKLQEEPVSQQVMEQFALLPSFHDLPGVQFISNTTFRVHGSDDLQTFQWESCGFRMHVPSGALAKSVQCDVTVATSMSGSFEQPQEATPVSAVYYVETSKEFSKPIMLELEHCCHLDEGNEGALTFAVANTYIRRPPYRFQWLHGGDFQPMSSYGCISVSRFSLFEILLKKVRGWRTILYYGYLFCKQRSRCKWTVVLVISKKLTPNLQAVKHHYHNWHKVTEFTVHFSDGSDGISLDIPPEGIERDNGCWKIRPKFTPKIRKQDIDGFRPDIEGPASCELTVTWQKEDDHPKDLEYCINLSGLQQPDYVLLEVSASDRVNLPGPSSVTPPNTSVNLPGPSSVTAPNTSVNLPGPSSVTPPNTLTGTGRAKRQQTSRQTSPTDGHQVKRFCRHSDLDERPLLPELLKFPVTGGEVTFSIPERIGTSYSDFGIHLLGDETGDAVDGIVRENRESAKDINMAILKRWLKGQGRQPVTWRTLIEVLRDADLTVLASDIETVKCM